MQIKVADFEDIYDIFEWRNDPLTLAMFINENKVSWKEHEEWFKNMLENSTKKLYIGTIDNQKIGICRFDYDKFSTSSEISINMNPLMRGKKISFQFLNEAIKKYKEINNSTLKATVKRENFASIKIFKKSAFIIEDQNEKYVFLKQEI
jgi:RimJ/RimL family protein N-acetyltransferase